MLRDPLRTLLGVTRAEPQVMGQALLTTLQRGAPDLLPMASLLADVVQVEVPSTRSPTGSTRSSAPTGRPTSSSTSSGGWFRGRSCRREEAHWADGASVALLNRLAFARRAGPGPSSSYGEGRQGASPRRPVSGSTCRPLPPDVIERLVHRGHRGDAPATP